MLYLLKSLYQDKQQSPKSRMLRNRAYDANPENPDVQFGWDWIEFWSNEPDEALNFGVAAFMNG